MEKISEQFRAIGTDIAICFSGIEEDVVKKEIDDIKNSVSRFEKRFSRFIKDSELSQMNSACGRFQVSEEMLAILKEVKKYHLETKGVFDPTVLCALESVGYDRSFDKVIVEQPDKNEFSERMHKEKFEKRGKLSEITIDEKNRQVVFSDEFRIDLGGIGKGYIIDRIVQDILSRGLENFWISAGGDIFLAGKDGDENWAVGVQNPKDLDSDLAKINVLDKNMSIATSGVAKRKGVRGGFKWNHIIDPRTGLSVVNDILAVTVIAPSVSEADVFAKTVLILGREDGMELINGKIDTECLMIDSDLNILSSNNMEKYLIK